MPPVNDNFADAIDIEDAGVVIGTTVDATVESGEPGTGTRSVWYNLTFTHTGHATITRNSGFGAIEVYEGDALNSLRQITGSSSTEKFWANTNKIYRIRLGTVTGSAFQLTISLTQSNIDLNKSFVHGDFNNIEEHRQSVVASDGTIYIHYPQEGIYKSTNGGATWSLENTFFTAAGTAQMVIDSDDVIHFVYKSSARTLSYRTYTPSTDTLSALTTIDTQSASFTDRVDSKITIDSQDNIQVAYIKSTGAIEANLFHVEIANGVIGSSTQLTAYVSTNPSFHREEALNPAVYVDTSDNVYIFWSHRSQLTSGSTTYDFRFKVSVNLGSATDIWTTTTPFVSNPDWPKIRAAAAGVDGDIDVIFTVQDSSGDDHIYYANKSNSWNATELTDVETNTFGFSDSTNILLQKDSNNVLFLLWYKNNGTNFELYEKHNDGSGWSDPELFTTNLGTNGILSNGPEQLFPIISQTRKNITANGWTLIESHAEYGLLYSSYEFEVAEGISISACPYVSGGQVRKMVDTVDGLDHLEGLVIQAQMDGDVPKNEGGREVANAFTVTGGEITLPQKAAVVHAGLAYQGIIRLLKSAQSSELGTNQFKTRRIFLASIDFYRSLGVQIGLDEEHLDDVFDATQEALFSGEQDKLPNTSWSEEAELIIKQEKPLPAHVLSVITRSEVEEGN